MAAGCCYYLFFTMTFLVMILLSTTFFMLSSIHLNNFQACPEGYTACKYETWKLSSFCIKDFDSIPSSWGNNRFVCTVRGYKLCNNFCYSGATYAKHLRNDDIEERGKKELIYATVFLAIALFCIFGIYFPDHAERKKRCKKPDGYASLV